MKIFSKSPLLYSKLVQIFQIGPKHIIDFQASEIMIVFKHFFPKRFTIKFCIWKSNWFFLFSLGIIPKNGPNSKQGVWKWKNDTKTGISFNRAATKIFSPPVSPKLGNSENVVLTWPPTSWSLFTGQFFYLKKSIIGPKNVFLKWFYKNSVIYVGPGTCLIW